jgi:hypothetical protein
MAIGRRLRREIVVKPFMSILAVLGLGTALQACAYQPESKANLLADSGFRQLLVKTPKQVESFRSLPPHRLSKTTFKGKSVWVYPDRDVCGCLYIGTQTAYDAYIKKATQQMIDTRVNQMYDNNDPQPYNPTATMANLDWGDAWDSGLGDYNEFMY